ncbi:MAG: hypothetical protein QM811_30005 [Pirellulales bacterium]
MLLERIVFSTSLFTLILGVALAEAPSEKPSIPALIDGAESPKSFVLEGALATDSKHQFAFRVATDGKSRLTTIYDSADGVPIIISDGKRSLLYDFRQSRLVQVEPSFVILSLEFDPMDSHPFRFKMNAAANSNPKKLDDKRSSFRLDTIVENARRFTEATDEKGIVTKRSDIKESDRLIIVRDPKQPQAFELTLKAENTGNDILRLHASYIDENIPAELLAYPDESRFRKYLKTYDVKVDDAASIAVMFWEVRSCFDKLKALLGQESDDDVKTSDKQAPTADQKRDTEFGKLYLKALEEQNFRVRSFKYEAAMPPKDAGAISDDPR